MTQGSSRLLALPPELRNRICDLVFACDGKESAEPAGNNIAAYDQVIDISSPKTVSLSRPSPPLAAECVPELFPFKVISSPLSGNNTHFPSTSRSKTSMTRISLPRRERQAATRQMHCAASTQDPQVRIMHV